MDFNEIKQSIMSCGPCANVLCYQFGCRKEKDKLSKSIEELNKMFPAGGLTNQDPVMVRLMDLEARVKRLEEALARPILGDGS